MRTNRNYLRVFALMAAILFASIVLAEVRAEDTKPVEPSEQIRGEVLVITLNGVINPVAAEFISKNIRRLLPALTIWVVYGMPLVTLRRRKFNMSKLLR